MSEFSDLVTRERPRSVAPAPGGKSGALLATYEGGVRAIVKSPKARLPSGHARQRGIAAELHPGREIAFYRAAAALGLGDLVPETVPTTRAVPGVVCSAQLFVPARRLEDMDARLRDFDARGWGATLAEASAAVPKRFWKSLLVLDIIGGSRDRHSNNVGIVTRIEDGEPVYRIAAFDNAVSFGLTFDRYHNVFHKHLFRRSVDLGGVWSVLDGLTRADLRYAVGGLLTPEEINHAFMRARFFVDYPYRLPWKVCSKGNDDPREFPDYSGYFSPVREGPLHMARIPV